MMNKALLVGVGVVVAGSVAAFFLAGDMSSTRASSGVDASNDLELSNDEGTHAVAPKVAGEEGIPFSRRGPAPTLPSTREVRIAPERPLVGESDSDYQHRLEWLAKYRAFVADAEITPEQEQVILRALRDEYEEWRVVRDGSLYGEVEAKYAYYRHAGRELVAVVESVCTREQVLKYKQLSRWATGLQLIVRTDEDE